MRKNKCFNHYIETTCARYTPKADTFIFEYKDNLFATIERFNFMIRKAGFDLINSVYLHLYSEITENQAISDYDEFTLIAKYGDHVAELNNLYLVARFNDWGIEFAPIYIPKSFEIGTKFFEETPPDFNITPNFSKKFNTLYKVSPLKAEFHTEMKNVMIAALYENYHSQIVARHTQTIEKALITVIDLMIEYTEDYPDISLYKITGPNTSVQVTKELDCTKYLRNFIDSFKPQQDAGCIPPTYV